jgi:hypothetical protein
MSQSVNKLNILIAYPYFKPKVREILAEFPKENYRLIVDSGAFSAYNSGHAIELPKYCEFLTDLKKDFNDFDYVQLDVVFNEEKTKENYKRMLDLGFDPAPVFTRGADFDYFHELIEAKKYIFVGGVQRGKGANNFAKWVLENSGNYKEDRVHLLAYVRPDMINHYQPFSVDSSSWTAAGRYGLIPYYTGNGRLSQVSKKDFIKKPKKAFLDSCARLKIPYNVIKKLRFQESWFNTSKFDYNENPNEPSITLPTFITACQYVYYTIEAEKNIGTRIYMAIGDSFQLSIVLQAYNYLRERKVI